MVKAIAISSRTTPLADIDRKWSYGEAKRLISILEKRKLGYARVIFTKHGYHLIFPCASLKWKDNLKLLHELKADKKFIRFSKFMGYSSLRIIGKRTNYRVVGEPHSTTAEGALLEKIGVMTCRTG